jgi:hypothetical protein
MHFIVITIAKVQAQTNAKERARRHQERGDCWSQRLQSAYHAHIVGVARETLCHVYAVHRYDVRKE